MTDTDELFLITGATGNSGAHTVKLLRERGLRVRALVHSLDERADRLRELGTEVVQGDPLDFPAVSAAYFKYPVAPGLVEVTANFVRAACEAGVHAVVNMSQIPARRDAKSNAARAHWIAERLLDRSALITTHLRPTFFTFLLNMFWIRDTPRRISCSTSATWHRTTATASSPALTTLSVIGGVKPITVEDYVAATAPSSKPARALVGERGASTRRLTRS